MKKINILFFSSLILFFWEQLFSLQASPSPSIPVLKVYTSRSFAKGVGKAAKELFEKTCKCKVEYMTGKSPLNILSTLKIIKNKPDAIVQISDDFLHSMNQDEKAELFLPIRLKTTHFTLPIQWKDPFVIPLSYGILSFLYNSKEIKSPPRSFEDLKKSNDKIILIDPRTSNPGLGLLLWLKQIYGTEAQEYWINLKPKILTITKGWSEATALFLKGEASLVLSYASSPAYYQLIEQKSHIRAALFEEGHYLQIYIGAILKDTKHAQLAEEFIKLLLSQEIQKKIVYEDWSYPVLDIGEELPEEFKVIKKVIPPPLPKEIRDNKKMWLQEWLNALS